MTYYHYTNLEAVLSILSGETIRMGSLAYMNDENEGKDFARIMHNILRKDYTHINVDSKFVINQVIINQDFIYQFAFCSSLLADNLSQWRAYTTLGQGACLEFEDGFLLAPEVLRHKCIYEEEKKKELVKSFLKETSADNLLVSGSEAETDADNYVEKLTKIYPVFKSHSFAAEEETRWTLKGDLYPHGGYLIEYCAHRLGISPYIEVPVDLWKLNSITLGPKVPSINERVLQSIVLRLGFDTAVLTSTCSLR